MKKITILLALFLISFSSAIASAECRLDLTRWKWVDSNKQFGEFFDIKTLKSYNNHAEVWVCDYYPGDCGIDDCKVRYNEHYHYMLTFINYNNNTIGTKSYLDRDSQGNVVFSHTKNRIDYDPIVPDSMGEELATKVRETLYRR